MYEKIKKIIKPLAKPVVYGAICISALFGADDVLNYTRAIKHSIEHKPNTTQENYSNRDDFIRGLAENEINNVSNEIIVSPYFKKYFVGITDEYNETFAVPGDYDGDGKTDILLFKGNGIYLLKNDITKKDISSKNIENVNKKTKTDVLEELLNQMR